MEEQKRRELAADRSSPHKLRKAFAIGGSPQERASFCYCAAGSTLLVEHLATIDELTSADLALGSAFFVCSDFDTIATLNERLAAAENLAPIIGFAGASSMGEVILAFETGASSFIAGPFSQDAIFRTIETASRRSQNLATLTKRALAARSRLDCLSQREREVVEAVAEGLSNKVTALSLSISPRTVEIHRANAFAKLDVENAASAIRLVLEAAFVPIEPVSSQEPL